LPGECAVEILNGRLIAAVRAPDAHDDPMEPPRLRKGPRRR
jgi:hypothetical protein